MVQAVVRVGELPDEPHLAAAAFYRQVPALPDEGDLALVFAPAEPAHRDWRRAAVRDMARAAAPAQRVNGVVGIEGTALDQVLDFLSGAPAITGQVFDVDGTNG